MRPAVRSSLTLFKLNIIPNRTKYDMAIPYKSRMLMDPMWWKETVIGRKKRKAAMIHTPIIAGLSLL
jgi:hypothetical protein